MTKNKDFIPQNVEEIKGIEPAKAKRNLPLTKVENTLTTSDDVNDMNYIWNEFGTKPNKIGIHSLFDGDVFWEILESYGLEDADKNIMGEIIPSPEGTITSYRYTVKIEELYISFYDYSSEKEHTVSNVIIYFKSTLEKDKLQEYLASFSEALFIESEERNVDIMTYNQNMLGLSAVGEPFEYISDEDNDLFDFYSTESSSELSKLIKKIESNRNGIYALSGQHGLTTMYLNYLISNTKKSIVIVPINLINTFLGAYDFIDILKQYPNTIYIIENGAGDIWKYMPVIKQALKGIFRNVVNCDFLFYDCTIITDLSIKIEVSNDIENVIKKLTKKQKSLLGNYQKRGSFY